MSSAVIKGIDHVGITVDDIDAATDFLERAFGARVIYDALTKRDQPHTGQELEDDTGVAPGTVLCAQRIIAVGSGPDIELFEMAADDQRPAARGSDIGINHLALYTDDAEAAVDRFVAAGGRLLSPPRQLRYLPERGERNSFCYGRTPWGMIVEFISYPDPMPYRQTTSARRWHDRMVEAASDHRAVLERFYAAETAYLEAEEPDFAPIAAVLDPDCTIRQPDALPYGGIWRGHRGFEAWMKAFRSEWSQLSVTDPRVFPSEGGVIFSLSHVRAIARRSGAAVEWPLLQYIEIASGKIREIRPFHWDTTMIVPVMHGGGEPSRSV